jgi:hypothetical protein
MYCGGGVELRGEYGWMMLAEYGAVPEDAGKRSDAWAALSL